MKSSRGEIKISEILDKAGLPYKEEYSFPDLVSSSGRPLWPLRFDFCVFDDEDNIDFLIEYQGIQHYEAKSKFGGAKGLYRQQYNDKQKQIYCNKNGYKLIVIPYWMEGYLNYDYIMKLAYDW